MAAPSVAAGPVPDDEGVDDAGERARAILEAGGYQTRLPGRDPGTTVAVPVGSLGVALFWLGALLVVALCIWFLARELGFGDHASLESAIAEAAEGRSGTARTSLEDSDRLAADGRFDEAVHALLLLAIRHLSTESGREPHASATARELVRTFRLEGERRRAFADLVRAVEWSLFGGRPVAADEYARCRDTFRTLVAA